VGGGGVNKGEGGGGGRGVLGGAESGLGHGAYGDWVDAGDRVGKGEKKAGAIAAHWEGSSKEYEESLALDQAREESER